jgi:ABC-type polysaccharide/polyol phosphate transport system ATPase subunit
MTTPLVEVDSVSKAFWIPDEPRHTIREHVMAGFAPRPRRRLPVLDSVSLQLRQGEAVGVMGANGCGKSTLLKLVCGIYIPDEGTITTRAAITPILDLGVGWNPELDAVDNVYLIGGMMGLSLMEISRSLDSILEFAELRPYARMHLKNYSSGMAARLAYAVAFQAVRDVLVLDEVLAVGDAGFKKRCEQRYREIRAAGHTTLVVSHEPYIIGAFCDRAVMLQQGRIVAEGPAADVAAAYLANLVPAT